jgi:hypothetical protein
VNDAPSSVISRSRAFGVSDNGYGTAAQLRQQCLRFVAGHPEPLAPISSDLGDTSAERARDGKRRELTHRRWRGLTHVSG